MTQQNKVFADGMRFDVPQNAPEWVKGKISIKVAEFIPFLEKNQTNAGWINLDVKQAGSGKYYVELNTWKPSKVENTSKPIIDPITGIDCSDIGF